MESSIITIIILCVVMVLYMTELFPIATTSLLACLAFAVFGVIPVNTAFSGFGSDTFYLVTGMIVVGNALFETGAAQMLGKKILSAVGASERAFALALISAATVITLFISNTATTAIMLPVAASAIRASGGKLKKKNTYMMMGMVIVASGGLTLVGSTPQLIAQGLLQDGGHETMGFFEIGKIGLPVFAFSILYFQTIGRRLQSKLFDFDEAEDASAPEAARDGDGSASEDSKGVGKMCIAAAILIFCIVGFVVGLWSMGVVAIIGAVMCVVTRCISQKKVFQNMDWTTIIIMGCSLSFGAAIDQSGAGKLVAQSVVNLLGDSVTPWLLCAALALVAMLISNFMSSTATAALLIPISALIAIELGYNVKSVVMATAIAANLGYATPISTPPLTMTLSVGYRFMDYVKVGGLLNLLTYILITLLFPIMLSF